MTPVTSDDGPVFRRKAMDRLKEWRARPGHQSLLLRGQRQVGKSFILERFAETYGNSAIIDLSSDTDMARSFETASGLDDILAAIGFRFGFTPVPGDTLIVLDEVQSCPRARQFLKQFTLDGRFDVIASGSLLDIPLRGVDRGSALIPVGYEEHMRMFGLDFEEFLWAKGFTDDNIAHIKESIRSRRPLSPVAMRMVGDAFREYMAIGGMPGVVRRYLPDRDVTAAIDRLNGLVLSTKNDITKFGREDEALKILKCFESIPYQLGGNNKRFMYSRISGDRTNDGARRYADSLLWIEGAGIGNPCYHLRQITRPVSPSRNLDVFRMYLSDTGMLVRMMDDTDNMVMDAAYRGDRSLNQGAIAENVVAECLMKAGIQRNYWIHRKDPGRTELDFVIDLGDEVAAVEVDSGKKRPIPSLRKTLGDDRFQRRIVFGDPDISVDGDGIEHYPLFAAAFINEMRRRSGDRASLPPDDDIRDGALPQGPGHLGFHPVVEVSAVHQVDLPQSHRVGRQRHVPSASRVRVQHVGQPLDRLPDPVGHRPVLRSEDHFQFVGRHDGVHRGRQPVLYLAFARMLRQASDASPAPAHPHVAQRRVRPRFGHVGEHEHPAHALPSADAHIMGAPQSKYARIALIPLLLSAGLRTGAWGRLLAASGTLLAG